MMPSNIHTDEPLPGCCYRFWCPPCAVLSYQGFNNFCDFVLACIIGWPFTICCWKPESQNRGTPGRIRMACDIISYYFLFVCFMPRVRNFFFSIFHANEFGLPLLFAHWGFIVNIFSSSTSPEGCCGGPALGSQNGNECHEFSAGVAMTSRFLVSIFLIVTINSPNNYYLFDQAQENRYIINTFLIFSLITGVIGFIYTSLHIMYIKFVNYDNSISEDELSVVHEGHKIA